MSSPSTKSGHSPRLTCPRPRAAGRAATRDPTASTRSTTDVLWPNFSWPPGSSVWYGVKLPAGMGNSRSTGPLPARRAATHSEHPPPPRPVVPASRIARHAGNAWDSPPAAAVNLRRFSTRDSDSRTRLPQVRARSTPRQTPCIWRLVGRSWAIVTAGRHAQARAQEASAHSPSQVHIRLIGRRCSD